jgi:hypothetical protein
MGYWLACAFDGGCRITVLAFLTRVAIDAVLSQTGLVLITTVGIVAWRHHRRRH